MRFGFVTFSKEESVMKVLNRSEKLVLDGQELDVKPAFKRSNEEGGLPPVKRPKKSFIPKEIFNEMVPKPSAGKVFVGGLSSVKVAWRRVCFNAVTKFLTPTGNK